MRRSRRSRAPKPRAGAACGGPGHDPADLVTARRRTLAAFERLYVLHHLRHHKGNIARAARRAGISASALRALIARHGIDQREYLPPSLPRLVVRQLPPDDA
jgi:DNA-binding NtrC family response regulator